MCGEGCINATYFSFILCLLICISGVILYCINPGSLYFPQPLLLGLVMCVALECHACGAGACFLEHSIRKVRDTTLVPAGAPLHNTITTIGQYGQSQSGIGARRAA
jgi:hypothetical protein